MSSYFSGTNGSLWFGGSTGTSTPGRKLGKVTNWSYSTTLQTLPTTTLMDTDETGIPGIRQQAGSFTLYYYDEPDSNETVYAKTVIDSLVKAQTTASEPGVAAEHEGFELRLQINNQGLTGVYVQGKVYLTNVSMTMAVGEVVAADCQFKVDGAFQQVTM